MTDGASPAAPPDWGRGHYERTAALLLPAARVLVEAAEVGTGQRVLDLGSGTGNAALLAAAAGAEVVAVDPSERLLAVAAAAARARGLDLTCRVGHAAGLPVADSSVDRVLSNFGVIFAPDPAAAVAEMARVLSADGRAVLTAWVPGGAVGALAATARELVRDAVGTPATGPGVAWHDVPAVAELFAPHRMRVSLAGRHELVFTADSPEAYLDTELSDHPMAIAALEVLRQRGQAEGARQRMLQVVIDNNEAASGFLATSRYVVLAASR